MGYKLLILYKRCTGTPDQWRTKPHIPVQSECILGFQEKDTACVGCQGQKIWILCQKLKKGLSPEVVWHCDCTFIRGSTASTQETYYTGHLWCRFWAHFWKRRPPMIQFCQNVTPATPLRLVAGMWPIQCYKSTWVTYRCKDITELGNLNRITDQSLTLHNLKILNFDSMSPRVSVINVPWNTSHNLSML